MPRNVRSIIILGRFSSSAFPSQPTQATRKNRRLTMPVATRSLVETMIAKDQPTPIPDRVLREFADLNKSVQARNTSSDQYKFEVSLTSANPCALLANEPY
jgi:hypothetical protein